MKRAIYQIGYLIRVRLNDKAESFVLDHKELMFTAEELNVVNHQVREPVWVHIWQERDVRKQIYAEPHMIMWHR